MDVKRMQELRIKNSTVINQLSSKMESGSLRECISTGVRTVDQFFDGGLEKGLTFLAGTPGIGKTSFALQLAFNMAKEGHVVCYFHYEMSTEDLILKTQLREANNLTRLDRKTVNLKTIQSKTLYDSFLDEEKLALSTSMDNIRKLDDTLRFYDCHRKKIEMSEIESIVEDIVMKENKRPVIFIDYLQKVDHFKHYESDKYRIDHVLSRCKLLSDTYGIPLILLSSVNRSYYTQAIDLAALKESGNIEYDADVILGLEYDYDFKKEISTFDISSACKKNVNGVDYVGVRLSVLKARFGASNTRMKLLFDSQYGCFKDYEALESKKPDNCSIDEDFCKILFEDE